MSTLILCPSCARHVRAQDTRCPFCSADVPATSLPAPIDVRGLSRSAILVIGALTVGACQQAAAYGGPPPPEPSAGSSAADAGSSDAMEPTNVVAIYGAPSPQ